MLIILLSSPCQLVAQYNRQQNYGGQSAPVRATSRDVDQAYERMVSVVQRAAEHLKDAATTLHETIYEAKDDGDVVKAKITLGQQMRHIRDANDNISQTLMAYQPATQKQVNYLKSLYEQLGASGAAVSENMSKAEASHIISGLRMAAQGSVKAKAETIEEARAQHVTLDQWPPVEVNQEEE